MGVLLWILWILWILSEQGDIANGITSSHYAPIATVSDSGFSDGWIDWSLIDAGTDNQSVSRFHGEQFLRVRRRSIHEWQLRSVWVQR